MDNFNYRKFVYDQSLTKDEDTKQTLNENAPGYDTRKFGEALPTLESVKAAHEAKEDDKKEIKEGDLFSSKFDRPHLKDIIRDLNEQPIMDMAVRRAYKFLVSLLDAEDKAELGLNEGKLLKEEEEELMPKKISDEVFTIVYQTDDMTEYEAYNELLSDREQDLIRNSADVFIFTNKTPAGEIKDFVGAMDRDGNESAEEGNINLERVGLDKYWKY